MLWIKIFHIILVIAWIAGLLYLPRILAHYGEGRQSGEDVRRLGIMARKLLHFTTIVSIQAILAGIWLWYAYGLSGDSLNAKLVFVVGMVLYHLVCWGYLNRLLAGKQSESSRYIKYVQQVPLILLLPILVFGVVKPF